MIIYLIGCLFSLCLALKFLASLEEDLNGEDVVFTFLITLTSWGGFVLVGAVFLLTTETPVDLLQRIVNKFK